MFELIRLANRTFQCLPGPAIEYLKTGLGQEIQRHSAPGTAEAAGDDGFSLFFEISNAGFEPIERDVQGSFDVACPEFFRCTYVYDGGPVEVYRPEVFLFSKQVLKKVCHILLNFRQKS